METKHTPGPWKTRRFDNEADGRHNFTVQAALCEVARMSQVDQDIAEANARRIVECVSACEGLADPSVVPELLKALVELTRWANVAGCDREKGSVLDQNINAARAAIAKATGKTI